MTSPLTVIFMVQRPNIAMLIVRAKFTGILSDSVRAKFTGILSDSVRAKFTEILSDSVKC